MKRFSNRPLYTRSWLTIDRAAEITGQSCADIRAAIETNTIACRSLGGFTLVDRVQITEFFRKLTPAALVPSNGLQQ